MIPEGLRYHTEHEWLRIEKNEATLGITHFAQDSLGDIVYVELPKVGAEFSAGQEIGEVESTKTTSAIYTPVGGKILAVNPDLKDHPELINQDPYGKGWIVRVAMNQIGETDGLMDASGYRKFLQDQEHK